MKTTVAFYLGPIQEEHKHLQTYLFKDGYSVEEKGVIFLNIETAARLQSLRFKTEPNLLRIDIHEPGVKTLSLIK